MKRLVLAFLVVGLLLISGCGNKLTSIEAITSAKRPVDVTEKEVDLKLVQIPEYDQTPGDRPVVTIAPKTAIPFWFTMDLATGF